MDTTTDITIPPDAEKTTNFDETTSPYQLQEVTSANGTLFDQTKISPMRGRSVKEYDEQITTLKKENFNLKLRIYFLEERMGSAFRLEDKDNILRKNIEYKVEIQTLHKELDEKRDLLCQAVKALELEDSEHKRIVSNKTTELSELAEKINSLELENKSLRSANNDLIHKQNKLLDDSTSMYNEAFGLQSENSKVKEEIQQLQDSILQFEQKLVEEQDHSALLENELRESECLQLRCKNLETELHEKNSKLETLVLELEKNGHTLSSYNLRIRTLEDALIAKNSDLNYKDQENIQRDNIIKDYLAEIDDLRRSLDDGMALCEKEQRQSENLKSALMLRDNTIADLESKLEKCKTVIRNLESKLDSIAHENKRQKDELFTMKQQRRSRTADDRSRMELSPRNPTLPRSTCSSTTNSPIRDVEYSPCKLTTPEKNNDLKDEVQRKDQRISKLEEDHLKACRLIQTFIANTKTMEREIQELKILVQKKDLQFEEFKKHNVTKYSTSSVPADKENSVEETDDKHTGDTTKDDKSFLEWEKQIEGLLEVLQDREEQLKLYKDKYELSHLTLQQKDNRIVELETEVNHLKDELNTVHKKINELTTEKLDISKEEKPVSWIRITEEKDKKIEQLEHEVRKQTQNLQGIVNNELWDKNREIEKIQNRFTDKLFKKEKEVSVLEKELTAKDIELKMLKDKINELGVQISLPCSLYSTEKSKEMSEEVSGMKEQFKNATEECKYLHKLVEELRQQLRNTPERDGDNIAVLKAEHMKLLQDYEKSEKLRIETGNMCSLLTTRLEELAYFLDSLLKHKSVLGMLGTKQRSAIKQAIDQSLDLSKSLSVSMNNEDQSLLQLSNITGLLNTTQASENYSFLNALQDEVSTNQIVDSSLTFNSHLTRHRGDLMQNDVVLQQAEIISILRAQIERMKTDIRLRDMEICKQNMDQAASSDSLKNDNDLVAVLIDLQNSSIKNANSILSPEKIYHNLLQERSGGSSQKNQTLDNQSESEAWSEPDRCVSQQRIGLDTESLKNLSVRDRSRSNRSASIEEVTSESTEDERGLNRSKRGSGSIDSRHTINLLQDNLGILENKLKEKENEITSLKISIQELDNKSLELKLKMSEDVAKLRNEKIDVETLLKETEEKIKNVDVQNKDIVSKLDGLRQERDAALHDVKDKTEQLETLKNKIQELEISLRESDEITQKKLKECENNWKEHLNKIEQEAEIKLKAIEDAAGELKKQYETNWIEKTEMNKYISEVETVCEEQNKLKNLFKLAEIKIDTLEKSEFNLKKELEQSENLSRDKIVALKRELSEAMLQVSEAVLERTKISNEKLKLETELRRLESKETEKCNQLNEKEKEFLNMRNILQKQITQAEQEKSCLQLKVSELESLNADLHNRLVKFQTGGAGDQFWTKTTATSPPKISELVTNFKVFGKHSLGPKFGYIRQRSDMSGYASETHMTDENDGGSIFNKSAPDAYHWFPQNTLLPSEAVDVRNIANSSPDLGIESDQGRFSSLETNVTTTRPLLQTLELTASMNNLLSAEHVDNVGHYCNITAHKHLQQENDDLIKTIKKLESGLEVTKAELSKINKNKKQVEKALCKQIHKTSIVLRQARANLDSGSENENKRIQ